MLYQRILLPVDGTKHSDKAVAHAIHLAEGGGEVLVLTVLPSMPRFLGGDALHEAVEAAMKEGRELTKSALDALHEAGIPCEEKIIFSDSAAEAIITAAQRQHADIIVMGSRGRNAIQGLFLGSVTHRVLTLAEIPVMVIS